MRALQRETDNNCVEISLDRLSLEEAWELIIAIVGEKRISRDDVWAQHVISTLCEWLGYLPLGLKLMGQYLAENPALSLGEMLKRLQAQRLQYEAINGEKQQVQPTLNTTRLGLRAAFELCWRELDPLTQNVAQLLSLFAPVAIPWKLVEMLQATSLSLNWSAADINWAKTQLCQWHLIKQVEDIQACYTIHPLIREFLQAKLAASEQAQDFKRVFAVAMVPIALKIPASPLQGDIKSLKEFIPHLEEVAQSLTDAVEDDDLLLLLDRLGRLYQTQGLYDLAENWFVKCLSVAQARLGYYHPDVATAQNNLAGLYYTQGRLTEAEPLYIQALNLRKRFLGGACPEVATTLNNLAGLYYAQKRFSEAEPLYVQALELRKFILGNDHPDVATTLNNLALLYYAQARYDQAEPLYTQALELRKRLQGDDHPDVATTLNNLALLYYAQARYDQAEPLYTQALEVSERVLGSNHPNTMIFRKNLALFQAKKASSASLWQMVKKKILPFVD